MSFASFKLILIIFVSLFINIHKLFHPSFISEINLFSLSFKVKHKLFCFKVIKNKGASLFFLTAKIVLICLK